VVSSCTSSTPEHCGCIASGPCLAARFAAVVNAAFDPYAVLNSPCLLPDERFLDAEHACCQAQARLGPVIGYVKAVRQHHAQAGTNGGRQALADQWSRALCDRP
jgi:hypothetical protein